MSYARGVTDLQREVLRLLLDRHGEILCCKEIVSAIWPDPDDEPDWAEQQVYKAISQIRRRWPGLITAEKFVILKIGQMLPVPHPNSVAAWRRKRLARRRAKASAAPASLS